MCSHRAPPAPMVPSKREMEDSSVPRPLKAADLTQSPTHRRVPAPPTSTATSAVPAPASSTSTNPAASLGALGLDLLGSVAAYLHPLDLARVGLCSRGLLVDIDASAALLLKRMPTAATAAAAAMAPR